MTTTMLALLAAGAAAWILLRRPALIGDGTGELHMMPPAAPADVRRWQPDALDAGRVYDVAPQLVLAVIWQESAGVPTARGSAGEIGLMQLKDVAAQDAGWNAATWEPRANIFQGASFLALQIDRMGGDVYDGLRAYNQGEAGARSGKGHAYAQSVLRRAGWH